MSECWSIARELACVRKFPNGSEKSISPRESAFSRPKNVKLPQGAGVEGTGSRKKRMKADIASVSAKGLFFHQPVSRRSSIHPERTLNQVTIASKVGHSNVCQVMRRLRLERLSLGPRGKTGTASNVLRAAARAAQSSFDRGRLPRPSFFVAEYNEARGIKNGHSLARSAIDAEAVSVSPKITDII